MMIQDAVGHEIGTMRLQSSKFQTAIVQGNGASHVQVDFVASIHVGARASSQSSHLPVGFVLSIHVAGPGAVEILTYRRWVRLVDSRRGRRAL
jgi:hypothetical protein